MNESTHASCYKILERLLLSLISSHILSSDNFNRLQSAYRKNHSTETCLLKTLADTYSIIDQGHTTLLASLDLSAAFDTIPHQTLLQRLQSSFGLSGKVLDWIASYLSSRSQYVTISDCNSTSVCLPSGVPQGSVLGPLLFTTYISPMARLVSSFGLNQQQYADDTQLYFAINNTNHASSLSTIHACLSALSSWFAQNGLCLNPSKTESILLSTPHRLRALKANSLASITIQNSSIPFASNIRTLGVNIDSSLTMSDHVRETVKACNFHIRAIRHICHLLSEQDTTTIAVSLVQSKLDYCNSLLSNTSAENIRSLQRIQNCLARLVLQPTSPAFCTSSKSLLQALHWLPVQHRITFKLACITHSVIHTKQPSYLHDFIHPYNPSRSLRSSNHCLLTVPRTHLSLTAQSFHVAAPKAWNSLPTQLRNLAVSKFFRSELKTHLFNLSLSDP